MADATILENATPQKTKQQQLDDEWNNIVAGAKGRDRTRDEEVALNQTCPGAAARAPRGSLCHYLDHTALSSRDRVGWNRSDLLLEPALRVPKIVIRLHPQP